MIRLSSDFGTCRGGLSLTQRFRSSVACTRFSRKVFLELALFTVQRLRVRQGLALHSYIRPQGRIVGIDLKPFVETRLRIRLDGFCRTFGFANPAIDAFVRVD